MNGDISTGTTSRLILHESCWVDHLPWPRTYQPSSTMMQWGLIDWWVHWLIGWLVRMYGWMNELYNSLVMALERLSSTEVIPSRAYPPTAHQPLRVDGRPLAAAGGRGSHGSHRSSKLRRPRLRPWVASRTGEWQPSVVQTLLNKHNSNGQTSGIICWSNV